MKPIYNINVVIFIILLIEIVYIMTNYKKFIFTRMRIKSLFGHFVLYKVYSVILTLIFIFLLMTLCKILNINIILACLFLLVSGYLYTEYKLYSNHTITRTKKPLSELKHEINTGDFIIYETPRKISDYFCLVPVLFLNVNHIGIWIKDTDGQLYILECDASPHFCEYSKKIKSGVMLLNVEERLKDYDDYYLIKTNIHKYITNTDVLNFIEKYKDRDYMENKLNCITLVLAFLKRFNLIKRNLVPPNSLYVDYKFLLDPSNYTKTYSYDIVKILNNK